LAKEFLSIFNSKIVTKLQEIWVGDSRSRKKLLPDQDSVVKKASDPEPGSASQLFFWDKSLLLLCCSHGGKEPNPFDDESEEWDEGDTDTG
jgi:hypothetical protein